MSSEQDPDSSSWITEGCMVEVQRRCWPGMNKPGGFAMIKRLLRLGSSDEEASSRVVTHVDVWYPVEGRKENRVPIKYVKIASDLMPMPSNTGAEGSAGKEVQNVNGNDFGGRRRRNTLGRCTRCHSLRQDCGSCDWLEEQRLRDLLLLGGEPHQSLGDKATVRMKRKKSRRRTSTNQQKYFNSNYKQNDDKEDISRDQYSSSNDETSVSSTSISRNGIEENLSDDEDDLLGFVPFRSDISSRINVRKNVARLENHSSILENLAASPGEIKERSHESERVISTRTIMKQQHISFESGKMSDNRQSPSRKPRKLVEETVILDDHHHTNETSASGALNDSVRASSICSEATSLEKNHDLRTSQPTLEGLDFIQPEGNPNSLPEDIQDRSRNVDYVDLISLFEEISSSVQSTIADFEIELARIKAKLRKPSLRSDVAFLQKLCEQIEDNMMRELIHEGIDQLRNILRRCENRREYRRNKKILRKRGLRRKWRDFLELNDIKFTDLQESVEKCFKTLDSFYDQIKAIDDQPDDLSSDESCVDASSSIDSDNNRIMVQIFNKPDDNNILPPFDPHIHATRAKTNKSIIQIDKSLSRVTKRKRSMSSSEGMLGTLNNSNDSYENEMLSLSKQEIQCNNDKIESILDKESIGMIDSIEVGYIHGNSNANKLGGLGQQSIQHKKNKQATLNETSNGTNDIFSDRRGRKGKSATDRMKEFLDRNKISHSEYGEEDIEYYSDSGVLQERRKLYTPNTSADFTSAFNDLEKVTASFVDSVNTNDLLMKIQLNMIGEGIALINVVKKIDSAYPCHMNECLKLTPLNGHGDLHYSLIDVIPIFECFYNITSNMWQFSSISKMIASNYLHLHFVLHFSQFTLTILQMNGLVTELTKMIKPKTPIHDMFVKGGFVEFVALQVIDILYSQICNDAWDNTIQLSPEVWQDILKICGTLRQIKHLDHVGMTIPITEVVSRVLLTKASKQRYYSAVDSNIGPFYVSLIDPNSCKYFLENGFYPSAHEVRIKSFGDLLPRKEIEAVWKIFTYFIGPRKVSCDVISTPYGCTKYMTNIMTILLFSKASSLARELSSESDFPPSNDQLIMCYNELNVIDSFIRGKLFDPKGDKFVMKLITRSVTFYADKFKLDSYIQYDLNTDKEDAAATISVWNDNNITSDLLNLPMSLNELESVKNKDTLYTIGNIRSLAPSSYLLSMCCKILHSWLNFVVCGRAARNRFKSSLQKVLADLTQKTNHLEVILSEKNNSNGENTKSHQIDLLSSIACLRLSIGFLSVTAIMAVGEESARDLFMDTSLEAMQEMWNRVGGEKLEIVRTAISNATFDFEIIKSEHYRLHHLFGTSKIMTSFYGLEESSVERHQYHLSCLVTCLLCSIGVLYRVNEYESMAFMSSKIDINAKLPNAVDCARIISRICILILSNLSELSNMNLSKNELEKIACIVFPSLEVAFSTCLQSIELGLSGESMLTLCLTIAREATKKVYFFRLYEGSNTYTNGKLEKKKNSDRLASFDDKTLLSVDTDKVVGVQRGMGVLDVAEKEREREKSNDGDEFASIEDEAFLNMDLDAMIAEHRNKMNAEREDTNVQHCGNTEKNRLKASIHNIRDYLCSVLFESKPSSRFAVRDYARPSDLRLSSSGMSLVSKNVEKITSILAYLTCVQEPDTISDNLVYPSRLTTNFLDISYMKRLGQCFSVEFCRLVSQNAICERLIQSNITVMIVNFFEALFDSSVLSLFPTSNFSLVQRYGGDMRSFNKKVELITTVTDLRLKQKNDPDASGFAAVETQGRTRIGDGGSILMCENIWNYGSQLSDIMNKVRTSHFLEDNFWSILPSIITSAYCESRMIDSTLSRMFQMIPRSSLEGECIKRLQTFSTFCQVFQQMPSLLQCPRFSEVLSATIRSMLEHLQFVSETLKYLNAELASSTRIVKARALQVAYTEMSATALSIALRCCQTSNNMQVFHDLLFFRNSIVIPSLSQKLNLKRALQEGNFNTDDLIKEESESAHADSISHDILLAVEHNLLLLLIHFALSDDGQYISTAFFEGVITNESTAKLTGELLANPRRTPKQLISRLHLNLSRLISGQVSDNEYSCIQRLYDDVLENFLLRKLFYINLKHSTIVGSMNLLQGMLSVFNIDISPERASRIIKVMLCRLIDIIPNMSRNESILNLIFSISRSLLKIPIHRDDSYPRNVSVLEWAYLLSSSDDVQFCKIFANYVKTFADFIFDFGTLLMDRSQSMKCLNLCASIIRDDRWEIDAIKAASKYYTDATMRRSALLLDKIKVLLELEEGLKAREVIPTIESKVTPALNKYKSREFDINKSSEEKAWYLRNAESIVAVKGIQAQLIEMRDIEV